LVPPDEIVVEKVQSDSVFVVRQLLREDTRKGNEPPHTHPHGKVLLLDKAGRNVNLFRRASDDDLGCSAKHTPGEYHVSGFSGWPSLP
jgi:hypothetical protein